MVSRLRKALPDGVVEGQPDGYLLRVEPDAVDAVLFERLVIAVEPLREEPCHYELHTIGWLPGDIKIESPFDLLAKWSR